MNAKQVFKIAYALQRFSYSADEINSGRSEMPAHHDDFAFFRAYPDICQAAERALEARRDAAELFRATGGRLQLNATHAYSDAHIPAFD